MSHTELYNKNGRYIYFRGPSLQYTIWIENAVGDSLGALILRPTFDTEECAEMQIPLKRMSPADFLLWKEKVKEFCLHHQWKTIAGYTTQKFGDDLILTEPDNIKWTDVYIQVGQNQKRKLLWHLNKGN